jgi:hypothetical protein
MKQKIQRFPEVDKRDILTFLADSRSASGGVRMTFSLRNWHLGENDPSFDFNGFPSVFETAD